MYKISFDTHEKLNQILRSTISVSIYIICDMYTLSSGNRKLYSNEENTIEKRVTDIHKRIRTLFGCKYNVTT